MVFRRVVDAAQLKLSLKQALRKYDVINVKTGPLVPGDHYEEIPIDQRIFAPHESI